MSERDIELNQRASAFSLGGVVHEHGLSKREYVHISIVSAMLSDSTTLQNVKAEDVVLAALEITNEIFRVWDRMT